MSCGETADEVPRHRKYVVLRDIDAKAADATKLQMKPKEGNVREIVEQYSLKGAFELGCTKLM